MSGLLELLQRYCTTNRSGEWLDFAANSTGVTLAVPLGLLFWKMKPVIGRSGENKIKKQQKNVV
jgi:hypothetical protein